MGSQAPRIALHKAITEFFDYWSITVANRRREFDPAAISPGVIDRNLETLEVPRFTQPFEPFDRRDCVREQVFAQTEIIQRHVLETIKVYMIQRQAPVMLLDHGKTWAQDLLLGEAQAMRQAFDEAGLANAKLANEC